MFYLLFDSIGYNFEKPISSKLYHTSENRNYHTKMHPRPPMYGLSSLDGLSKLTGAEVKVPFYLCPTNTVGRRP